MKRRSIEAGTGQKTTILFSEISTAKHFNLSPIEFKTLSRIDRKILQYQQAKQAVFDDIASINAKQKAQASSMKTRR